MRATRLLKVAADAELLRLRLLLKRQGIRAAFGLLAAMFAISVLVLINVVAWQVLRLLVPPIPATLILLGLNLVLTGILAFLAARSSPGEDEREALRIRQQALLASRASVALSAIVPIAGTLLRAGRENKPARKGLIGRLLRRRSG